MATVEIPGNTGGSTVEVPAPGLPAGFDWMPLVGARWTAGGQANAGAQVGPIHEAWSSPSGNTFRANADILNANGAAEGYTWMLDATDTLADIGLTIDDVMSGEAEVVFFIRTNIATTTNEIFSVGWNLIDTAMTVAGGIVGDLSPLGDILAIAQNGTNGVSSTINTGSSELWSASGVITYQSIIGNGLAIASVLIPDAPGSTLRNYCRNGPYAVGGWPSAALFLGLFFGKNGVGTATLAADFDVWIAKRPGLQESAPA